MTTPYYRDLAFRLSWQLAFRLAFLFITGLSGYLLKGFYEVHFFRDLSVALAAGALATFTSWPLLLWIRGASLQIFAWAQMLFDIALTTSLVWLTGGLESSFIILFAVQVLVGALILNARGALGMSISSALIIVWMAVSLDQSDNSQQIARLTLVSSVILFLGSTVALVFRSREKLAENLSHVEESLKGLENLHQAILENIPSGIAFMGPDRRIRYLNPTAIQILEQNDMGCMIHESVLKDLPSNDQRSEIELSLGGSRKKRIGFQRKALGEQGALIVFQDVTEIRDLEARMNLNEKLAGIGRLAAGIAHEIRNPLASLSGSVQLLKDEVEWPQAPKKLIQIVLRETDRLDALLQDFLDYAKPSSLRLQTVNLADLVADVFTLCQHLPEFSKGNITLTSHLPRDFMLVCDPHQMKQVIWNLIKNSIQSMEQGGSIELKGHKTTDSVRLVIRDSGPGISEEIRDRIFDPFFSTKTGGTGLGLPMVFQIVKIHQGTVGFESQVGKGTEFWIELPSKGMQLATSAA